MGLVNETPQNPTQQRGISGDGIDTLPQEVHFQAYTRVVLSIDQFIFWTPTTTLDVVGALRYGLEMVQNEDETFGSATVTFTTQAPITQFVGTPINTIYVATMDGFQFAFSQQQGTYDPDGPTYHYFGRSIPPAMSTQLLGPANKIDITQAVVSNSLPLWLQLNNYASPFYDGFANVGTPFYQSPIQLFPSDMVPTNQLPPYGAVHIGDDDTEGLQVTPLITADRSHYQLCADRVRITFYGLQNNLALDFQDTVNQYSLLTNNFGIMAPTPVMRDAKRKKEELQTIAMKKIFDIRVSYNQARVAQVARQQILTCVPSYLIAGGVV